MTHVAVRYLSWKTHKIDRVLFLLAFKNRVSFVFSFNGGDPLLLPLLPLLLLLVAAAVCGCRFMVRC